MERKITGFLEEWKADPRHKPLILTGCRRTGKTHSVLEFAESHYDRFIHIDFERDPEKALLFEGSLEGDDLLPRLSLSEMVGFGDDDTIIVLDGIQECHNAYSALKPLAIDGRVDVVAIGSFPEADRDGDNRISPLGYVNIRQMHPMDFEEYLWAMGVDKGLIQQAKGCIRQHIPLDEGLNTMLTDHYRRFMVIGGMPEAVRTFSETQDLAEVSRILDGVVRVMIEDSDRRAYGMGRTKVRACMTSIPKQLSRPKKAFVYSDIEGMRNVGSRVYGNSLDWLEDSGIAYRCRNVTEPTIPLSGKAEKGCFKVYMTDTGVLTHLMKDMNPTSIILGDPFAAHSAVLENSILSDLLKLGYRPFHHSKRNSTLEIAFVIGDRGRVRLIEVRSRQDGRAKALRTLMGQKADDRDGFKVMLGNILTEDNGIVHLPIYAFGLMEPKTIENIPPAPDAGEINRVLEQYKRRPENKV